MQTIKEQLKTGQLSLLHLLYGEERYMVRYYKNNIIKILNMEEDSMNYSYFEGNASSISEIVDVIQTAPFFAEKRLVIVENSGFFKSANDMADYLEEIPESTCLVFVEKEVDKRNRLYKLVQKQGVITEAKEESEQTLIAWIGQYLKRAGKSVSSNTAYTLLAKVGTNMESLTTELEKLIGYVGERESVEGTDVEAICTTHISNKIFEMIDAVASRQQKRAMTLYYDLLSLKEPSTRILYLLARHVNIMIQVSELEEKYVPSGDICKKVGIPPFAVRKYSGQAKTFGRQELLAMLKDVVGMEESVKTGRLGDQMAVELFIVQYSVRNDH